MRRDVFQAIADPNRRAILSLLAKQRLTPGDVADNFRISRPAVSRHIKILAECGLIYVQQQGRQRYCEVRPEKLIEVSDWLEQYRQLQYRQLWEKRFDRLDNLLVDMQKKEKPNVRKK
jgi:DNA-binding transcriptional ArsR family regulator